MFGSSRFASLLLLAHAVCRAQTTAESDAVERVGEGVTPPRLTRKVEPEYSASARSAHVQGTVMLQLIVDRPGGQPKSHC